MQYIQYIEYMQYILIHTHTYSTCTYDTNIETNTYNIHETYKPEIATYMHHTYVYNNSYVYVCVRMCVYSCVCISHRILPHAALIYTKVYVARM